MQILKSTKKLQATEITHRFSDKVSGKGPVVDGKPHGHWELLTIEAVEEGDFVEGRKQGLWTERCFDGTIIVCPWVDGLQHGTATVYIPGGALSTMKYESSQIVENDVADSSWKSDEVCRSNIPEVEICLGVVDLETMDK